MMDTVNVRSRPSTSASIVGRVPAGTRLPSQNDDFYKSVRGGYYRACGGTSTTWAVVICRNVVRYVAGRCARAVTG
jgi:hypothetical protein